MHPNPGQFLFNNLHVIVPGFALLWIGLTAWMMPSGRPPVTCPFCHGRCTIKVRSKSTQLLKYAPCPHCHASGVVASFHTRYQHVRRTCGTCFGRASLTVHDTQTYADGTPLPGAVAQRAPCSNPKCKRGWQMNREAVYSKVVPVSAEQLAVVDARRADAKDAATA